MVAVQESLQRAEGIRMWEKVIACVVKTMKWVVSRQVILFLGFLLVVVMLFVASLLAEDYMQEKQQAVTAGTTIVPESINSETDQAVGRAIEQYEAVLDAQWTDRDCTLSFCPHSSRAIPGVPTGRGLFTKHERNNIEERGNLLAYPPHHAFKFAAILNCTASKQKIMMSLKQSCTSQLSKHPRITRKTATVPTFTS